MTTTAEMSAWVDRIEQAAIGLLGLLPALLGASHVVLAWENADLCTALELDEPDGFPAGMVVVTADRRRHTRCWHPMRLHADQIEHNSEPRVIAEWGPVQRLSDAVLPDPITDLLTVWRAPQVWSDTDQLSAYTALEGSGYQMRWVRRPVVGRQPTWVRLFEPLMA